ncbi:hypothetical protein GCM10023215_34480 [Pseudonocardia yuanmonensis]|uniref:Anti-sigma K factor RskA C-terminal domain-containing protein n=1 Tax=Pseudonocardia yuanmonensis TaxID=1095914 RepID=A0ABP8WTW4_9PSEU
MPHPGPDELVAAALTRDPVPGVADHLAVCPSCREEVEALRRTAELVGDHHGEPLHDPPPEVWDRVAGELGPELGGAAAPAPARPARSSRRRVPALLVAAALVVGLLGGLGTGLGIAALREGRADDAPSVPLVAVAAGSAVDGSTGLADVDGSRVLTVRVGRAQVGPGEFLEAWLIDAAATRLYTLGALTPDGPGTWSGRFVLPADLPLDVLDTVDVSIEAYDGDPGHSGDSLLRGRTA